jgi:5-methylcytosine-specific restriction endonuclease McrA
LQSPKTYVSWVQVYVVYIYNPLRDASPSTGRTGYARHSGFRVSRKQTERFLNPGPSQVPGFSFLRSSKKVIWRNMRMPFVIRLSRYRKVPQRRQAVTRRNIFGRDLSSCQYCGMVFPSGKRTLDHILPRWRGGRDTWENRVTCCRSCNHRKADRTPEEAGMALIRMPRAVSVHAAVI